MSKRPASWHPGEPSEAQGRHDMPPTKDPPERPDPVSVRPPAREGRSARRPDRYDVIGAAIVVFIVALWVVHFLLPAPPPDVP